MLDITRRSLIAGAALGATSVPVLAKAPSRMPSKWDLTADVVVVGAGGAGLPAAIGAADAGLSVLVVDTNYDIGGHAIVSGGNVPLGGGTAAQKKHGVKDDPDTLFQDLIDWSVNEVSGMPDYRYNDRGLQFALSRNEAQTYDFLVENGVPFVDKKPDNFGAHATGLSAPRENHTVWKKGQSLESPAAAGGTLLMRSLEASARKKGVRFLLNYHMDEIFREGMKKYGKGGRVTGIAAHYTPTILPGEKKPLQSFRTNGNVTLSGKKEITVRARKAVVIATGGSSGNVLLRRVYDPRLTKEYACAAEEWSPQDGSGELAGIAIGAALWGTANQTMDRNGTLRKRPIVGVRTNYIRWTPQSPIWKKVKYTGLLFHSWKDAVVVNQTGRRFYAETEGGYPNGTKFGFYKDGKPYVHGDWRNTTRAGFRPMNYTDAALAVNEGSMPPDFASGPQWVVFDSEVARKEPLKDGLCDPNLFFKADTLPELASKISTSTYSSWKMDGKVLEETVRRYNELVAKGSDDDFGKKGMKRKIEKGPFYAAWCTFPVHDTYAGLHVDMRCRVLDWAGNVIPGLYCGGESAAGSSQHGLGRCMTEGYIIGKDLGES